MIELREVELFKDFTSLEIDDKVYDLHNDYICTSLKYDMDAASIHIFFEQRDNANSSNDKICLTFRDVVISKFNISLRRSQDSDTLNSLYRGRFEKEGVLLEYSLSGQGYYYVEFEMGDQLEFFSQRVVLLVI